MDLTTAQTRLTEAETALHALLTGARVASCTGLNGSIVQFVPASAGELRQYISYLQTQVAQLSGSTTSVTKRRPIFTQF